MPFRRHRELIVWQKAMELAERSSQLATRLPPHEQFALAGQVRRAAISVPANIAEGHGRMHRGDYFRHVSIARGSAIELATHLELALRLGYIAREEFDALDDLCDHVARLLIRLANALRPCTPPSPVARRPSPAITDRPASAP